MPYNEWPPRPRIDGPAYECCEAGRHIACPYSMGRYVCWERCKCKEGPPSPAQEQHRQELEDYLARVGQNTVTFDPAERAHEKQASRDEDQRQLDAGEITRAELAKRNGAFAFPRDRVRLVFPKRER